MYYFVIGQDGSRFGPADVDTLVHWAKEGRLIGDTQLIERGTDRSLRAAELPALRALLSDSSPSSVASSVKIERGGESPTMTHAGQDRGSAGGFGFPPSPPRTPHYADRYPQKFGEPGNLSHRSKIVAGVLGILLGWLGAHRFYLGYWGIGLIQILLSCTGISLIWGMVEGVVCLLGGMTDVDGRELRD